MAILEHAVQFSAALLTNIIRGNDNLFLRGLQLCQFEAGKLYEHEQPVRLDQGIDKLPLGDRPVTNPGNNRIGRNRARPGSADMRAGTVRLGGRRLASHNQHHTAQNNCHGIFHRHSSSGCPSGQYRPSRKGLSSRRLILNRL